MPLNLKPIFILTIFAAFCLAASPSTQAANYTVSDLGPTVIPVEINNSGQTTGWQGYGERAFVGTPGALTPLGTLGGFYSQGFSINNLGHAVGTSTVANGRFHAFLYKGEDLIDLGTLGGGDSVAYGINDSGQIVGYSFTGSGPTAVNAFIFSGGSMVSIGTFGGVESFAYGINNAGQVVGLSRFAGGATRAFLYQGGSFTDLGPGSADGINDAGQIIITDKVFGPSYLYSDGVRQELDFFAYDINNSGQIVGKKFVDGGITLTRPFIFSAGVTQDLNELIPANTDWLLAEAIGINDTGQIVGIGLFKGRSHGFLLTPQPVPEPATLLLIGTGLAGTGGMIKRRRQGKKE